MVADDDDNDNDAAAVAEWVPAAGPITCSKLDGRVEDKGTACTCGKRSQSVWVSTATMYSDM